jgi:hypothetical protein
VSYVPTWRLQTTWWKDTLLPADGITITPHFDDQGVGTDPQGLCDDLLAALQAWEPSTSQIRIRAYDAQGTVPVFPQGDAEVNTGVAGISTTNREVAVCLSFYSERNRPRQRGRLYIPACITGQSVSGPRVPLAHQQKVGDLAQIFQDLGGPDVDWVVYSPTDDVARPVTHWWVDNAWDTVRSRGLAPDSRIEGTTSEA